MVKFSLSSCVLALASSLYCQTEKAIIYCDVASDKDLSAFDTNETVGYKDNHLRATGSTKLDPNKQQVFQTLTLDGIQLQAGWLVYIKDETTAAWNGLYQVDNPGGGNPSQGFDLERWGQSDLPKLGAIKLSVQSGTKFGGTVYELEPGKIGVQITPGPVKLADRTIKRAEVRTIKLYLSQLGDGEVFKQWEPANPHLHRNEETAIEIFYPRQNYQISVNGQDLNYSTTSGGFTPAVQAGMNPPYDPQPAYYYCRPQGDDFSVTVSLTPYQQATPPTQAPITYNDLLPVDFGFLQSVKVAFSAGVLDSQLQDDIYTIAPPITKGAASSTTTGTIMQNLRNSTTLKGIALVHFSLLKSGDNLFGPAVGVVTGTNSETGYFLGGSYLFGKQDRLALSLGWEFSGVARLSHGYSVGETGVPVGSMITQNVTRTSALQLSLSYAFTIPGVGSGNQGGGGGLQSGNQGGNQGGNTQGNPTGHGHG